MSLKYWAKLLAPNAPYPPSSPAGAVFRPAARGLFFNAPVRQRRDPVVARPGPLWWSGGAYSSGKLPRACRPSSQRIATCPAASAGSPCACAANLDVSGCCGGGGRRNSIHNHATARDGRLLRTAATPAGRAGLHVGRHVDLAPLSASAQARRADFEARFPLGK